MAIEDFKEIYLVDFEFHPINKHEGNRPMPVCMVVKEFVSGKTHKYWQNELQELSSCPLPVSSEVLWVAYFATAEMDCFEALGWALPVNLLDLFTEFRWLRNGADKGFKRGLIAALRYFGLESIATEEKERLRDLILGGGPWSESKKQEILDYCESDVTSLLNLLPAMVPSLDLPRALLRGRYMQAVSRIQSVGVPIDSDYLLKLTDSWNGIQKRLIEDIDVNYGVYVNGSFKSSLWNKYLEENDLPWPRLESGNLSMDSDTFKSMSKIYPQISPIAELRATLAEFRLSELNVGEDGRNRCLLSPFSAKTGRNQPSTTKFIFGPAVWLRGLIKPAEGYGIAYVDWSQQEFGIAAALSGDENMMEAYKSGDPYLAFAKQASAVPANATKSTHKNEREQFKACVLAVQYGMGDASLAQRIDQPIARAKQLLKLHRQTYKKFWAWSDRAVDEAILNKRLWSAFGWQILVGEDPNDRSLRNFPMQANGAEMLRIACILLTESGIRVCAPVHDALLVEAKLEELDEVVEKTQNLMKVASEIVLNGFSLNSDANIIKYPERYMDERGAVMWETIEKIIC